MARIVVRRREKSLLEIELPGEDHSLPNLIVRLALERPEVEYASYSIDHPLVGAPRIVIRTSSDKDPLEVLREILEEIRSVAKEFREQLEEQLGGER